MSFSAYVNSTRKLPCSFWCGKRIYLPALHLFWRLVGRFRRSSVSLVNAMRRTRSVERWPSCTWDRLWENLVSATQPRVLPAIEIQLLKTTRQIDGLLRGRRVSSRLHFFLCRNDENRSFGVTRLTCCQNCQFPLEGTWEPLERQRCWDRAD